MALPVIFRNNFVEIASKEKVSFPILFSEFRKDIYAHINMTGNHISSRIPVNTMSGTLLFILKGGGSERKERYKRN